jgi:protein-histidine pros-kinase
VNESANQLRARDFAASASSELLGALIVLGEDGTILSWNDGAASLFGYSHEEALGKSIFETIVPADLVEEKQHWLVAVLARGAANYESVRRRKDNVRIWVDVSVRVETGGNGQRMVVLNERDITRI